ncbi:MAG TPA: Crp/Fnr family transcriptional regulator [Gemmatimonadales bacterium]|nr:Crp/Fnr family transcriptional regulator [Gemmatimonadales bacterium]
MRRKLATTASRLERPTLEESELFRELAVETRRVLARGAVIREAEPGTVLFHAGAPVRGLILILAGTVRVVSERQGRQHLVHESGPGETLGEVPLFSGGGYPATAVAQTRCVYAVLAPEVLLQAMQRDAALAWLLLRRLAGRVRHLVELLERNTVWSVESRLAEVLLRRQEAAGTASFALGMTQHALAEELGTVREVLVRELAAFCRDGLVRRERRGYYRVIDAEALRRRAM